MKVEIIVNKYRAVDGTDYKYGDIAEVEYSEGMAAIAANVAKETGKQPEKTPEIKASVPEPEPVEPVSKRGRPPGKPEEE